MSDQTLDRTTNEYISDNDDPPVQNFERYVPSPLRVGFGSPIHETTGTNDQGINDQGTNESIENADRESNNSSTYGQVFHVQRNPNVVLTGLGISSASALELLNVTSADSLGRLTFDTTSVVRPLRANNQTIDDHMTRVSNALADVMASGAVHNTADSLANSEAMKKFKDIRILNFEHCCERINPASTRALARAILKIHLEVRNYKLWP